MLLLNLSNALATPTVKDSIEDQKPQAIRGFVDFNGYYDTRNSFDLTLNALVILPKQWQYLTFTNYYSNPKSLDFSSYYSEHHLYKGIGRSPVDFSLQLMTLSGASNDALRFGLRYKFGANSHLAEWFKKKGLVYNLALHLYQIDNQVERTPFLSQVEHFYRLNIYKERLYLSGFIDQDLYYSPEFRVMSVTEHQLGYRFYNNWLMVAEFRYNPYLNQKVGVGLGLEYFMPY